MLTVAGPVINRLRYEWPFRLQVLVSLLVVVLFACAVGLYFDHAIEATERGYVANWFKVKSHVNFPSFSFAIDTTSDNSSSFDFSSIACIWNGTTLSITPCTNGSSQCFSVVVSNATWSAYAKSSKKSHHHELFEDHDLPSSEPSMSSIFCNFSVTFPTTAPTVRWVLNKTARGRSKIVVEPSPRGNSIELVKSKYNHQSVWSCAWQPAAALATPVSPTTQAYSVETVIASSLVQ